MKIDSELISFEIRRSAVLNDGRQRQRINF
jgi:hypothetical protein